MRYNKIRYKIKYNYACNLGPGAGYIITKQRMKAKAYPTLGTKSILFLISLYLWY